MMKETLDVLLPTVLLPTLATLLVSWLGMAVVVRADEHSEAVPTDESAARAQARNDLELQRKEAENRARPEVEKQRKDAELEAAKTIDKDAVAALEETRRAISAIAANKNDEALAAIERATGKINILLVRKPSTAILPVDVEVEVIDVAPRDQATILEIAQDASRAVDNRDFPTARVLLRALMSEIRVRTYNLPLATYPTALKDAARLLDQNKGKEASAVLLTALNTLMVIDRVTPLPLLRARDAINQAQQEKDKNKESALKLLDAARTELQRSKALGYAGKDAEYASLNDEISNLEKQLKGNEDTTSPFARLKEKSSAFLKQFSAQQRL
jgi:hypothetical protein